MSEREEHTATGDRAAAEAGRDDGHAEESDPLLAGRSNDRSRRNSWQFWRQTGLFVWSVVATAALIVIAVILQHERTLAPNNGHGSKPSGKRNLIFMVSDGMGPTSLSLTRSFRQYRDDLDIGDTLVLDQHLIGQSRTRSSSSLITDSAAGATAFSCGLKSYNGAISVLPDFSPCGTVLEAAKNAGYMTGLVVTTRLTDATPACFASHVKQRGEEDTIARQMAGDHPLGRVVDLMLGGGRCHFLPQNVTGSCRQDDYDAVATAKRNGFNYLSNRKEFDSWSSADTLELPTLGLLASTDIPYEIDRVGQDDVYPSLDEMAQAALKALSAATADSDKGFFLMIEGSRIDHAGHANDPAAQVREVLAYDKAFGTVLDFLENDSTEGVAVCTSDHETGGLAAARQLHMSYPQYLWYPSALLNASHSAEYLTREFSRYKNEGQRSSRDLYKYAKKLVKEGLGIHDYTTDEINSIASAPNSMYVSYIFADMVSRRAQTGWATHGHSAADVNIFASSPSYASALIGNHENTEVGNFLRDFLDLDLEPVTEKLRESIGSFSLGLGNGAHPDWLGPAPPADGLDVHHYEGDFKKRGLDCNCGMH